MHPSMPVYVICVDGPASGVVAEVKSTARWFDVRADDDCVYHRYRRLGWADRIMLLEYDSG